MCVCVGAALHLFTLTNCRTGYLFTSEYFSRKLPLSDTFVRMIDALEEKMNGDRYLSYLVAE